MPPLPKTVPAEIVNAAAFNAAAARGAWPVVCDETCSFDHPLLGDLYKLWQSEAAASTPARTAMTARKLLPFMRNIAIYERIGEGMQRRYRVRLMGSGIVQYYGELTGKYFEEAVPEQYRDRWYAVSDLPLQSKKPVRLLLRADTFDKSHLVAEYFCAPLVSDSGLTKFVLLGMIFDGKRQWPEAEAEARQKLGLSSPAE